MDTAEDNIVNENYQINIDDLIGRDLLDDTPYSGPLLKADPLLKAVLRGFDKYLKQKLKKQFGKQYFNINSLQQFARKERKFFTNLLPNAGYQFSE